MSLRTRIAAVLAAVFFFAAVAPAAPKKPRKRAPTPAPADFDVKLPVLGTSLQGFPDGPAKTTADAACLQCHSASMAAQQRLTEKQWTATVEKMMRWGAAVPADRKSELVAYLAAHFGPDNRSFEPPVTRPVGR